MVDYCLRRLTHQIDGNEVILSKTLPKFEDEDPAKVEGGNEEEKVEDAVQNKDEAEDTAQIDEVKTETTSQVENENNENEAD